MAVDDDILVKNPFGFELAGVLVNDAVTREAISKDQMRKFLKFVHDDVVYCKYYEVVYILFHTGMRISEFCGLTLKDIDFENRTINIDHQLQRTSDMGYSDISVTMNVYTHIGFDHVCRHTYCSNMAKSGMNPKTLQYLMGHSDISVTMNVYTHIGFDDAEEELKRMEEFRKAQAEVEQKKEKPMSQKMFKVI